MRTRLSRLTPLPLALVAVVAVPRAQPRPAPACSAVGADSLVTVAVPGRPFQALLGRIPDLPGAGRVYAATSPDDALLLLADESARRITVVDFATARTPGGASGSVLGAIPTGDLPIALTFSADGRWLLTTRR